MIRHPRRSIPATLLGLILLVICVLVALSAIQLVTGHRPLISFAALADFGARQQWSDPLVLTAGAITAALGVLLLACGLWPGKPTVLALEPTAETAQEGEPGEDDWTPHPIDAGVTRRGLASALRDCLSDTAGVTKATIRVRHRRIRGKLRTERRDTAIVREDARDGLQRRLKTIPLQHPPRLRLRVERKRRTA